ncbi:hypothetical protein LJY18_11155 [Pseudomonas sp. MMS21-TM103]|uniref:hypothetical protein n=1 Tax=Pseudomonas sp. MMS21 TM103 TaxID=2886506 RepID=UPI001EDF03F7|nr:hypothetical protein [Pseudomonas sp. MMS21 TM103]MCG4453853.1 hypothetical protein [Pseudomonas sp. MMS21 TM103]
MRLLITLASCLLLGACTGNPPSTYEHAARSAQGPIAKSNLEAIHNVQAIPLPLNPGLLPRTWQIGADEPRLDFGSSISNYRVFSLELKKGERYALNVNSPCHNACLGFNKFALKPRALLLDAYGTVIASEPTPATGLVGQVSLGWDGEAPEDGTYYLLVAADNEDIGKTIVIDNIWINNSPLMAVNVGMHSAPLGQINALPTSKDK